jgi:ADP-ribose pyrophosphatase
MNVSRRGARTINKYKVWIQAAKIVVLHDNQLVLVKQSRKGRPHPTYELPGGRVNSQESIIEGARRELREETGLVAGELIELGTFSMPSSPIAVTLFFTNRILEQKEQKLDPDEDIEVVYADVEEALRHVCSGKWPDTRLGFGLLLARSRGLLP